MKKDKYVILWDSIDGNGFTPYVYKNGTLIRNLLFPIKVVLCKTEVRFHENIVKALKKRRILDFEEERSPVGIILNVDQEELCEDIVNDWKNSSSLGAEACKQYFDKAKNKQNLLKNLKKKRDIC